MKDKTLVIRGLALFAAGDVQGAVRSWLAAKRTTGTTRQIETYLEQARRVAPAIVLAAEAEGGPGGKAGAALSAPRSAPRAGAEPAGAGQAVPVPTTASRGGPRHEPAEDTSDFDLFARALVDVAAGRAEGKTPRRKNGGLSPVADPWGRVSLLGPTMEVAEGAGGGFAMVATRPSAVVSAAVPAREMQRDEARLHDLLRLDDFTGALELAERILKVDATHTRAHNARTRCRENLEQMHLSKLGNIDAVPHVLVSPEQMIWLDLDHRAGFILAQVDGHSSFDEIIELTGLERLEALRILALLVHKGVVGARAA